LLWRVCGSQFESGRADVAKNVAAIQGGSGPNIFSDPAKAFSQLDFPYIGNIENRNLLMQNGLFSTDVGLGKRFLFPFQGHSLQVRAEAFNVTNIVTFDSGYWDLLTPSTFGRYSSMLGPALTWPRRHDDLTFFSLFPRNHLSTRLYLLRYSI